MRRAIVPILFILTLVLVPIPQAEELHPMSETEMAGCSAGLGFLTVLAPVLESLPGHEAIPGPDAFFSAEISGGPVRHTEGGMRLDGNTLVLDRYTVEVPARTYAHIRPAGMTQGPDFGMLHIGERRITVSGYIRVFRTP